MAATISDISRYKKSNLRAFMYLVIPALLAVSGVYMSLLNDWWMYVCGQVLLSAFFLQTFILLHECGHLNFFSQRWLNQFFGHVFGVLTVIPYYTWTHMHNLHHRWTGWRDKDPTTEKTVEPSDKPFMRIVANVCWWMFIPVFYLSYQLSNYWNLIKIKRFLSSQRFNKSMVHVFVYLGIYLVLFIFFSLFLVRYILPAFVLSMIWKELVIMTQHSHIEIPVSNGETVKPIPYSDQVQYTRSFYINRFLADYFLFNFNLHEAHHAHPGLPAYWLDKIELDVPKEPAYFNWLVQAKAMKGEDYVFRTSKHTGKKF